MAFSPDTTGKDGHSAAILPEAGREATFSIFPLSMPRLFLQAKSGQSGRSAENLLNLSVHSVSSTKRTLWYGRD